MDKDAGEVQDGCVLLPEPPDIAIKPVGYRSGSLKSAENIYDATKW